MQFVAKVNNVKQGEKLTSAKDLESLLSEDSSEKKLEPEQPKYTPIDLFRHSKLRRWSLLLFFIWSVK